MVGSISSGSGTGTASVVELMRSQKADQILKQADSNQDGKITEDELSKALGADANQPSSNVSDFFKQLDQGNKGYITKQDIENGLAKAEQGSAQGQQPAKGGGGGVRGGGGGGGGEGASATASYDPEDLNQDGTVTAAERIQYMLNLYAAQKDAAPSKPQSVYA